MAGAAKTLSVLNCVKNGDLDTLALLLNSGHSATEYDDHGRTPLYYCAQTGNRKITELLLNHESDVNTADHSGKTPLRAAAKKGHKEIVELLLSHKADVNTADRSGYPPLRAAAGYGHKEIVELLLSHKADVNTADRFGYTPLRAAAGYGHKEIVELLLSHKADVNTADTHRRYGYTPLSAAAQKGHKEIVELLLSHKADVNTADRCEYPPLRAAAGYGHKEIVELLLSHKADVNTADRFGYTPLRAAAGYGHKEIVELLLSHKADVNTADRFGYTPLSAAAEEGHKEIVELLLSHKADVNTADRCEYPPLRAAAGYGHKEIVELLLSHKADVNTADHSGYTPLRAAEERGHKEIVELLLSHGADVNTEDTKDRSCADAGKNVETPESVLETANYVGDETRDDPKAMDIQTSQVKPSSSAGNSDRDRAERIRASRGKYEVEVSCTGELGLLGCKEICDKNPGHDLNVFPVKDFNLDRLPIDYRDKLLVDYVQATSDITCRLSVSHISEDRPENWPLSAYKGENCMMTGTGWVSDVYKYMENDNINCQCKECSGTDTPQKTWGVVRVTTACFVVYDDEEARNTECRFYDSYKNDFKTARTLKGFTVVRSGVKGNCTEMMHITHDVNLLNEFEDKRRSLRDLRLKVFHKYCYHMNKKHDLCIIVSHPHGLDKTVSVGKLTLRQLIQKNHSGYEEIKHHYDTPTCPGSGGAAIITLVKEIHLQDGLFQIPAFGQNHVPTMVSKTGECGRLQGIDDCEKNPGHEKFFSIKRFNTGHLPQNYRDDLILQYVQATSHLTCCLVTLINSVDSPENLPSGFSLGTGWVCYVDQYTDREDGCQCQECCTQQVKGRKRPMGVVYLLTACHNLNNNEEARNTWCHLFYDSPDEDIPEKPTLTQFKIVDSNPEEDWAIILCYTDNSDLLDKLYKMNNEWIAIRSKLLPKYNVHLHTEVRRHDLCIIVSHPHGCGKTVTVGKWIERRVVSEGTAENEKVIYTYDTPTCGGSSGAPVLTLERNITLPLIHAEGGPGNDNSSAVRSERPFSNL